jgi:hypothetical protein
MENIYFFKTCTGNQIEKKDCRAILLLITVNARAALLKLPVLFPNFGFFYAILSTHAHWFTTGMYRKRGNNVNNLANKKPDQIRINKHGTGYRYRYRSISQYLHQCTQCTVGSNDFWLFLDFDYTSYRFGKLSKIQNLVRKYVFPNF